MANVLLTEWTSAAGHIDFVVAEAGSEQDAHAEDVDTRVEVNEAWVDVQESEQGCGDNDRDYDVRDSSKDRNHKSAEQCLFA